MIKNQEVGDVGGWSQDLNRCHEVDDAAKVLFWSGDVLSIGDVGCSCGVSTPAPKPKGCNRDWRSRLRTTLTPSRDCEAIS